MPGTAAGSLVVAGFDRLFQPSRHCNLINMGRWFLIICKCNQCLHFFTFLDESATACVGVGMGVCVCVCVCGVWWQILCVLLYFMSTCICLCAFYVPWTLYAAFGRAMSKDLTRIYVPGFSQNSAAEPVNHNHTLAHKTLHGHWTRYLGAHCRFLSHGNGNSNNLEKQEPQVSQSSAQKMRKKIYVNMQIAL